MLAVPASWGMNNLYKYAISVNNGVEEMEFGSGDGARKGEYNGVTFVAISSIWPNDL